MAGNKVKDVFTFMAKHSEWNEKLQHAEYKRSLAFCCSDEERLRALLFSTLNSQRQPRITYASQFWQNFHGYSPENGRVTLSGLLDYLGASENHDLASPFKSLFFALKGQSAWGEKTAALFVKNVIKIHQSSDTRLHFLRDVKKHIANIDNDEIFLPVDSVISHVFREYFSVASGDSFSSINKYLKSEGYNSSEILVWDNLWFWGFITQNSEFGVRDTQWNRDKYWILQFTQKDKERDIEKLAKKFCEILERK